MEHVIDEKRQIAVNLEQSLDGESTLYTRVHHDPVLHTNEEKHEVRNTTVESLEITDVGWRTDQIHPQDYAIDGVRNEDAWLLIRRFNKVSQTMMP
jgi:hypothetical protein